MRFLSKCLVLILIPLFAFTAIHKYYISVTQIDFIENKQSVQITSRIFIDDMEKLLRDRYDEGITLSSKDEPKTVDLYIAQYLKEKLRIKINNEVSEIAFIGKAYDADIVRCYLEIEGVKHIETFEVSNRVLFDVFEDQQNIVKTNINEKQKSFIFYPQKDNAMLKFN